MLNTEIPYENLSRDYNRLHELLNNYPFVVGFVAININKEPDKEYSECQKFFKEKAGSFEYFNFKEIAIPLSYGKKSFEEICKACNVQFFDVE